jgi:hypothetical protein
MDWTDFSDPLSGFDLVINAVKETHLVDMFLNKKKFTAVALTRAEPLSSIEGAATSAATYIFKARILGEYSPHQLYDDPCLLSDAGDPQGAINAIHQHTTFVGNSDPTSGMHYVINAGDLVEVELDKGIFSYNLERGRFMRVIQSTGTAGRTTGKSCGEVSLVFASMGAAGIVGDTRFQAPAIPGVFTSGPLPDGQYRISSGYGPRQLSGGKMHSAIDYAAERGTKVFAIGDGTVLRVAKGCKDPGFYGDKSCGGGFGNVVYIKHDAQTPAGEDIFSVYAHLNQNFVQKEQRVKSGFNLGVVGSSGSSTGPHLHLEIHIGKLFGKKVNPLAYLSGLPATETVEETVEEDHELALYEDPPGVEGVDWVWTDKDEGNWEEV